MILKVKDWTMGDHGEWYASEGRYTLEHSVVFAHDDFLLFKKIMEKNEPMKPILSQDACHQKVQVWFCPNCKAEVYPYPHYDYCPECGQHLDWGDKKMNIKNNDGDYLVQEKPTKKDERYNKAKIRYRVTPTKAYATCFTEERAKEVVAIMPDLVPSRRWKAVK